jgi:hypothetical protein
VSSTGVSSERGETVRRSLVPREIDPARRGLARSTDSRTLARTLALWGRRDLGTLPSRMNTNTKTSLECRIIKIRVRPAKEQK